jgi:diadenylate cyclase
LDQLSALFSTFRFLDLLDILAVSFILYKFLLIIQGSKSYQMLSGIVFLGAIFALGRYYELHSMTWILGKFFDYLFIILILLFQDQIRSALVSMSGTGFLGFGSDNKIDEQLEEVIFATMALSREKTGALMVFEKKHGLQNYSMTGTNLESHIHSDIIYSLLQTKSPLHDGAIILHQGKIKAAGCFLPLSKNIELDRHYGTRHRAALGISEITDAVAITVSEETGKIHVCFDGRFYFIENEDQLRKDLRRFLFDLESSHLEIVKKSL